MKGYIQVYTGNGKGKTTAAFGLALRAAGAGKRTFFGQLIKSKAYSEIEAVAKYLPDSITTRQYGHGCFIGKSPEQADIDAAKNGLKDIENIILSGEYDIVVIDEANVAVYFNLINVEDLIEVIKKKPEQTEIIITGRYAHESILEVADLVTEMREVKHYYQKGIAAREGIEC